MTGKAHPAHNWNGVCERCERAFGRYAPPSRPNPRFCCQECRAQWLGSREKSPQHCVKLGRPREKHHRWQSGDVDAKVGRARALRWFPQRPCEACTSPDAERHHRNANTTDNSEGNIQFLCRRCHMAEDGRILKMGLVRNGQSATR